MNQNPFDLDGRDVWVVGGAGYLGRPVVQQLALLGARVVCVDLPGRAFSGQNITPAELDLNDVPAVEAFVAGQISAHGPPHGLVLMAYSSTSKRFDELTAADFDAVSHGNLTATFTLARAVGDAMADRGRGSIVLFSSMYGSVSPDPRLYEHPMNPNPVEYGVCKAGVQQLARYLAVHYGRRGVRCNSISPGPFPNPGLQANDPGFIRRLADKVPLGRVGEAAEISGAVAFLVSDASTFVTGHNLAVDGGWTAW